VRQVQRRISKPLTSSQALQQPPCCATRLLRKIVNNPGQSLAIGRFCGSEETMDETPIVVAVERIEAALARLEAALDGTRGLHQRHEALRASVARSLANLDALIARAESPASPDAVEASR
jgi:hypothetical protein